MLRKVNGRWAIVSRTPSHRVLAYYRGSGKPPQSWVSKQERRIEYFKHAGEDTAPKLSVKQIGTNDIHVPQDIFQTGLEVLNRYYVKYGLDMRPFATARYNYHLAEVREYWGTRTYRWIIEPKGGKPSYTDSGRQVKVFRTPPVGQGRIVRHVPEDSRYVYRGMSWEEWQFIRRTKTIQSVGAYNLGQENLTLFGNASTAEYYANGFTPFVFKPSTKRPGVVLAIPKTLTLDHRHHRQVPEGEYAIVGKLNASAIAAVWYLMPTQIYYSMMELQIDLRTGRQEEGNVSGSGVSYVVYAAH